MRRLLPVVALAAGWCLGGLCAIAWAAWRTLGDIEPG